MSTAIINFLEPPPNWHGYHPMAHSNSADMTNIPHNNILRDYGTVPNQNIYFNPDTISLDYMRGKGSNSASGTDADSGCIEDSAVISWKQIHLANLHSVHISEEDYRSYAAFRKCIRTEIFSTAKTMIQDAYMSKVNQYLSDYLGSGQMSSFRQLCKSLNRIALDLLSVGNKSDEQTNELQALLRYKFSVEAKHIADAFKVKNNIQIREPMQKGKRHTDFIETTFVVAASCLRKNTLLPMFKKIVGRTNDKAMFKNKADRMKYITSDQLDVTTFLSTSERRIPTEGPRLNIGNKKSNQSNNKAMMEQRERILKAMDEQRGDIVSFKKEDLLFLLYGESSSKMTMTDRSEGASDRNDSRFVQMPELPVPDGVVAHCPMEPIATEGIGHECVVADCQTETIAAENTGGEFTFTSADVNAVPAQANSYMVQRARTVERNNRRMLSLGLVSQEAANAAIASAWEKVNEVPVSVVGKYFIPLPFNMELIVVMYIVTCVFSSNNVGKVRHQVGISHCH